ncbi:MAG: SPOR domain-containing protein [Bacteroidales bacterium]|nr:SPOR domain-containing protein [Bacteroidales bacterium]
MRTVKFFLILMTAIMVVTGCDWVRLQLGMATSEDIAALKKDQQQPDTSAMLRDSLAIADSLSRAQTDSIKALQAKPAGEMKKADMTNRYHVILGSFKDYSNSTRMIESLKGKGFSPSAIDFKNGFRVVSIASYGTLGTAFNEMYRLRDQNFGPDDIWVYDVRQNMHN